MLPYLKAKRVAKVLKDRNHKHIIDYINLVVTSSSNRMLETEEIVEKALLILEYHSNDIKTLYALAYRTGKE